MKNREYYTVYMYMLYSDEYFEIPILSLSRCYVF